MQLDAAVFILSAGIIIGSDFYIVAKMIRWKLSKTYEFDVNFNPLGFLALFLICIVSGHHTGLF